ncbi:hypothetical protein [Arcticibacter eurypsychrophilus]|uniref:hypothetical protein n=1 Tax=Arcticibacter eurypsychrophilus TaxID=1434752 RepID=UPI00084DCAFF|nr:hypothetical protein [Arcticibacter eurypsychrophilus]
MRVKTIFIILITALVTIILMNNTEEIDMWIFGAKRISKLYLFAGIFLAGFSVGALAMRPRKKVIEPDEEKEYPVDDENQPLTNVYHGKLSDEDRDYIS